jgi:transcriptional regulator with XRE-family HTH domain
MNFAAVIRQRLEELGLGQRDLAGAAQVTESYISQLLSGKRTPPLPNRTDIYDKMSRFLALPREELGRLATLEHHQALDRVWKETPPARFGPMRELVLGKCRPGRQARMRAIFDSEPFGQMESLITRTLIESVRAEARRHARDESWLRSIVSGRGYRKMRVRLIELLDSDPAASIGDFSDFLGPLIEWWDFDFVHFTVHVALAGGTTRKFGFREESGETTAAEEPGLRAFLGDATLGAGAAAEEIENLRRLRFPPSRRPAPLFYYRVLQALRDPLHFRQRGRRK